MCSNEVCLLVVWGKRLYFTVLMMGIITFLKLDSALDEVLSLVNFVYPHEVSFENVYVLLDIRDSLCFFECGTNEGLHMKLFKCIGSYALPFV